MINTNSSHKYYIRPFHFIKYPYVRMKIFWNAMNMQSNAVATHRFFLRK